MILALCGTHEGKKIVEGLTKQDIRAIVTVTTAYGANLLKAAPNIEILEERLTEEKLKQLIEKKGIKQVIDITHPYAENISRLAIDVCREEKIPYLRYERRGSNYSQEKSIILAEDFYDAAKKAKTFKGKIFLTIGSNQLPIFINAIEIDRLIARVLPMGNIIKKCEELGMSPENIIAMKGPFSRAMNTIMFKETNASVVVTKDSGPVGGTEDKIKAAKELKIPVILVKRPQIDYGKVYHDMDHLMSAINMTTAT